MGPLQQETVFTVFLNDVVAILHTLEKGNPQIRKSQHCIVDLITVLIGNKCFEIFRQQLSVNVRFGRDRFDNSLSFKSLYGTSHLRHALVDVSGYKIPVFDKFPIILLSASPRLECSFWDCNADKLQQKFKVYTVQH